MPYTFSFGYYASSAWCIMRYTAYPGSCHYAIFIIPFLIYYLFHLRLKVQIMVRERGLVKISVLFYLCESIIITNNVDFVGSCRGLLRLNLAQAHPNTWNLMIS